MIRQTPNGADKHKTRDALKTNVFTMPRTYCADEIIFRKLTFENIMQYDARKTTIETRAQYYNIILSYAWN